jgi:hypothetical protein
MPVAIRVTSLREVGPALPDPFAFARILLSFPDAMSPKIRHSQSSGNVLLALAILWGLISLVFLVLGLRTIRTERHFETESVTAPGTILSKRVSEKNGIDPSTKRPTVSRTHYLGAGFTDDRGRKHEFEEAVSSARWESAREDEAVEVRYLPGDPAKGRLAGGPGLGQAYLFAGLGALGVLMGLAVVVARRRDRHGAFCLSR